MTSCTNCGTSLKFIGYFVSWRDGKGVFNTARRVYCPRCRRHYWLLNHRELVDIRECSDPRAL